MFPSPPDSTHRSSLPHPSGSTIILQPSTTSLALPSPNPDRNSSKIAVPLSAPAEALGHSALGQLSSSISNKRKRDSEPHNVNASRLREAQEKVEQKRAKVAARVPSASTGPTQATVTSLADLYAQMRRDSGGQPGQQDASSVLPSARTLSGHGRGPASVRRVQNAPRGHSSGSSPDPIAISGDDSEIVMLKHVRPSPTQVRDRFKPMNRLAPPIRLKSPSKVESRTATPKSITGDRLDKEVPGVASKPKYSFAVVVPSPPKPPTSKPARLEQHLSVSDSSQAQDGSPARTPTNKPIDKLKEITNNALKPISNYTHPPALARPARPVETISDSTPEYGWFKRSRRGMGQSGPLSAEDLDILLGAVPVPFDFSLSRHHLVASEKGDEEGEESSLWWYHPIFEARAKADIRRTLRALLPADPAQDPPLPGTGADGWRAEIRPRQSRARIWAERLEDAFGPGPLNRGMGRKPRRIARPAGLARRGASESSRSHNGAGAAVPPGALVIATLLTTSHGSLNPPSQRTSPPQDGANEVALRPPDADAEVTLAGAEAVSAGESEAAAAAVAAAAAWTAALLPLVKGKTRLDKAKMALTSEALGEVERADERGGIAREVLKESALADTVRRLGELDGVPLGDAHGLRARARTLAERWRGAFGDDVVDLQQRALLPVIST